MKRVVLLMVSVVAIQFMYAQNVQFGVKAGLNIASIRDDLVQDVQATPRKGFHIGALSHIHLSKNWALQPEVMYSTQGANYDYRTYTGKDKFDYINVPVLVQYMTKSGLRVQTGPQFGYATSLEFKPSNGAEVEKTDIKKTDIAWSFGLGYLTRFGLGIDARYNMGLSNMYKDGIYADDVKAKHHVGQFGLFYQFKH